MLEEMGLEVINVSESLGVVEATDRPLVRFQRRRGRPSSIEAD